MVQKYGEEGGTVLCQRELRATGISIHWGNIAVSLQTDANRLHMMLSGSFIPFHRPTTTPCCDNHFTCGAATVLSWYHTTEEDVNKHCAKDFIIT